MEQVPQVDSDEFKKILKYIKSGVESRPTLEAGGEKLGEKYFYIMPNVFSNVQDDMLIAKDEIFGPMQSILKYKSLDEVIKSANASRFGLASGVFMQNIDTANALIGALIVGSMLINYFDTIDAAILFCGYKQSGQGREKGEYSLKNYLQVEFGVSVALKYE